MDNLDKFKSILGKLESGGEKDPYKAVNRLGYLGKYQFGGLALQDLGYKNKKGKWTGKDNIKSKQDFLNSPEVQEKALSNYVTIQERYLKSKGALDYVGKEIDGVKITKGGLLGAAHLVGAGAVSKMLRSGKIPQDANSTKATKYLRELGGSLEVSQEKEEPAQSNNSLGDLNPFAVRDAGASNSMEMPPLQPEQGQPMERIKLSAEEAAQLGGQEAPQPEQSSGRIKLSQDEYDRMVAPVSTAQAGLSGLAQGISGGFSDEILAATETGKQVLENVADNFMRQGMSGIPAGFSNIAESYNANVDAERAYLQRAMTQHPAAFMMGDIAGSLASTVGTMGYGGLASTGRMAASLPKLMSAQAGIGLVHGIGRSEEDTIMGIAGDAAIGAALGAAGELAGPALGMAGRGIQKVTGPVMPKVRSSALIKFLGDKFSTVEENLARVGKPVVDWAERVVNYTDIEGNTLIKPTQTRKKMLEDVTMARQSAWKDMQQAMKVADSDVILDAQGMYDDIMENVIDPSLEGSITPETADAAKDLGSYLKRTFFKKINVTEELDPKTGQIVTKSQTVPKDIDLFEIHKFTSDTFNATGAVYKEGNARAIRAHNLKLGVAKHLNKFIGETVEGVSEVSQDPALLDSFRSSRLKYGDLAEAGQALSNTIRKHSDQDFLSRMFNDSVIRFTSVGSMMGAMAGIPGAEVGMAIAGLRALSQSKMVNGLVIKSSKLLEQGFKQNPEKFAPIASRLVSASAISGEAFVEEMQKATAEVELGLNPLDRSTDAVIRRKDTLLTLLNSMDKGLAVQLREAIRQNDSETIQMVMSSLAKNAPKGYINEGIGWDGKAITEEDINTVNTMINKIKSTRKRMLMSTKFNSDKMIPQELFMPDVDPVNKFIYNKAKEKVRNPRY